MPKRIQRKRTKGWRMPPNTVSICRPGKYGNPFIVGKVCDGDFIIDNEHAKMCFLDIYNDEMWEDYGLPSPAEIREKLAGKNLACFCKEGEPCHGDILLKIANNDFDI